MLYLYFQLVQYAMGFAVLFAIGLLFVIFLPLCGCCICCCRCCCGNCGGDLKAVRKYNKITLLTRISQASFLWDTTIWNRPRLDAGVNLLTECSTLSRMKTKFEYLSELTLCMLIHMIGT